LDLIITNRPNQVNRVQILPGIIDHNVVCCEFDVKPMYRRQIPRQIALFGKADWTGFNEFASHLGDMILQAATAPHANTTC